MPHSSCRFALVHRLRRPFGGLIVPLLALLGASALTDVARAEWPPPKTATAEDMKNPDNWPNDPDYGYAVGETSKIRKDGQWELFSFLPERSPGAPYPLRSEETAAGMSVDLAWRHTIGDARVRIAVLDCGIKWDETELQEKAWLNTKELANHKPHMANGDACGGSGEWEGFDCNGDGILTVSDYVEEPTLAPEATDGHPRGDKNNNGYLDAGDLIILYSDGIDDDANGYVDDISGWDFMKEDNDPYEDTRFYHQSTQAKQSMASTNNGVGKAGVCPLCMHIPLRTGDSFIVNVNDFAQAVIYAVDNGASMIQVAVGSINQTSFSQAAVDYAYRHGVAIVASMADENSRHPNMPTTSNHTLPVHAIAREAVTQSTMARSFVHFNTCSNFGGHNFLSAPGEPCSSEAVGNFSGVMGLVYSAALQNDLTPKLVAPEAYQLIITNTDDINIPDSHDPESDLFYSQEGFDQRFGYGRVNANRAIEALIAGKIPPRVDITSPTWYSILYPDRVSGPVPIEGTVSAPRASSYDYQVEWAPGVQPLEDEFVPIPGASGTNIPGATVAGADSPIALFDISGLEIDNPPDPDDTKYRENRYTVTIRIRATAHYGGEVGDVPGQWRRTLYVMRDPDLLPGFPLYLSSHPGGVSGGESSPKLADLDGDGVRDLVVATSDGYVRAFRMEAAGPIELPGFPYKGSRLFGLNAEVSAANPRVALNTDAPAYKDPGGVDPDIALESFVPTVAIDDIDGDGKREIVALSWEGTLHVVGADGKAKAGWPVGLPHVPSCPLDPTVTRPEVCMDVEYRITRGAFGSPVLADMDKDGKLDIVVAAFDGKVYVFKPDGTILNGWPVTVHYTGTLTEAKEYSRIFTTPAVDDFTGDGIPDVVVGSNERLGKGENAGAVYVIDGRGNAAGNPPYLPNWPISMTSLALFPLISEGVTASPAVADFNGDGVPEVLTHGTASLPMMIMKDPGKQSGLGSLPDNALPERGVGENGQRRYGLEPTTIFGEYTTAEIPDTMFPLFAQPAIGDLNQDGFPDVTASGGSLSLAQNLVPGSMGGSGGQNLLAMWNSQTGKMMPGSPVVIEDYTFFNNQAIADITGDDYPEVITGTGSFFVRAADACGREAEGFPKFTGQWIMNTAAVGDIDGDKMLEVVVGTRNGWLYAWHTKGHEDGVIQWESFHHDNRNTGASSTKLDQGVYLKAEKPMDCKALLGAPGGDEGERDLGGGCSCRVQSDPTSRGAAGFSLLGAALALGLLRRKR